MVRKRRSRKCISPRLCFFFRCFLNLKRPKTLSHFYYCLLFVMMLLLVLLLQILCCDTGERGGQPSLLVYLEMSLERIEECAIYASRVDGLKEIMIRDVLSLIMSIYCLCVSSRQQTKHNFFYISKLSTTGVVFCQQLST